jgi:Cytochrome c7 and related cytochrome c
MAQIFHRSTNTISRVSIFGAVAVFGLMLWMFYDLEASPYTTQQNVARDQPVQFSHAHHVGAIGIDCRYWAQSPYLEPVRESFRTGRSLEWTRVDDLPDFAYFDHSIHVNKGIGCETCHGRVDRMPLVFQAARLQMGWCLECHRHPERFIRPKEEVFTMGWSPPEGIDREEYGRALVRAYNLRSRAVLESCSTCHR